MIGRYKKQGMVFVRSGGFARGESNTCLIRVKQAEGISISCSNLLKQRLNILAEFYR